MRESLDAPPLSLLDETNRGFAYDLPAHYENYNPGHGGSHVAYPCFGLDVTGGAEGWEQVPSGKNRGCVPGCGMGVA